MPDPYRILIADDDTDYVNLWYQAITRQMPVGRSAHGPGGGGSCIENAGDSARDPVEITCCPRAANAIDMVGKSLAENRPFAAVFIGALSADSPAGLSAARKIRARDPHVEIVILTENSSNRHRDVFFEIPPAHKITTFSKSTHFEGACHLAIALCEKWHQEQTLQSMEAKIEKLKQALDQQHRKGKALRASEQNYRHMVENQSHQVIKFDKAGRILFANPSYCERFGMPREELIGQTLIQFIHEEDRQKVVQAIESTQKPPYSAYVEERVATKKGWRWQAWLYTALLNEKKELTAIMATGKDITHRKKVQKNLEQHLHFLQTLLDTIPSPVFYKNMDGRYIGCNQAFADFVGIPVEKIIGSTVYDMGPKEIADTYYEKDRELFKNKGKQQYEWKMKRRSGEIREVIFNKATFNDQKGDIQGLIGVISDITLLKQSERALKDSKKKLQKLYFSLLDAQENERKRIAMELHDDFGQSLILLKLQLDHIKKELFKEENALFQECEAAICNVQDLIEKTRRLFHGLTPLTLHDMGLINTLKSMINTFSKHSRIRFSLQTDDVESSLSAKAKIAVYRIFQEMLSNIQKHADADFVSITIGKQSTYAAFHVRDNGKGFNREQSAAGPSRPFGLGLTSMDERVQMLGGVFELKSQTGSGTAIHFTIPFEKTKNNAYH